MPGTRSIAAATLGVSILCAPVAHADTTIEPSGVALVAPRDAECPPIVLPFAAAAPYATDRRDALHDVVERAATRRSCQLAFECRDARSERARRDGVLLAQRMNS